MVVIIEFVGFAGSGKTYIREQLVNAFGSESAVPAAIQLRVSDVISYALKKPLRVIYTVLFILNTRQKSVGKSIRYIKKLLIYRMKLNKLMTEGKKYIIVDEGILQKFRMIRSTSKKTELYYDSIKPRYRRDLFSYPDIVVHLGLPINTIALQRLNRRNKTLNESSIENEISKIKDEVVLRNQCTEHDIAAAKKEHYFQYIKIDNNCIDSKNSIISDIKECAYRLNSVY